MDMGSKSEVEILKQTIKELTEENRQLIQLRRKTVNLILDNLTKEMNKGRWRTMLDDPPESDGGNSALFAVIECGEWVMWVSDVANERYHDKVATHWQPLPTPPDLINNE